MQNDIRAMTFTLTTFVLFLLFLSIALGSETEGFWQLSRSLWVVYLAVSLTSLPEVKFRKFKCNKINLKHVVRGFLRGLFAGADIFVEYIIGCFGRAAPIEE